MRYPNTSGSALVASKEQQDDAMTDPKIISIPTKHSSKCASSGRCRQKRTFSTNSCQGQCASSSSSENRSSTIQWSLTGAQMLTIRANKDYMEVLRNDPNLMFDVYDVQPVVPGRWTYALPENAARAGFLCSKNKVPIEAATLRNLAVQAAELGTNKPVTTHAFMEHFGRIITPDILRYDLHIHIIFIPRDHPLYATHRVNLFDSHDNALNQVMTLPATYPAAPRATYEKTHHSPVLPTPPSAAHTRHLADEPTSPTKKSNAKEWKPPKDCPGLTCQRKEEYKKFVLECAFDGYGKYIDRFQNKLPAAYIDHLCTHNMALKWQQQCRRREIAKGATKYGEVEKGGPRYDHDAIHFLGVWWLCFRGHYHKDDLGTEFNNTFPDQKRDKEALLAQANRVAAKIKATESRAGTHFATPKDDPAYINNLKRWREMFLPKWRAQNGFDDSTTTQEPSKSKPQFSKKRKQAKLDNDTDEDEQDEQDAETSRLKYRRKDRA